MESVMRDMLTRIGGYERYVANLFVFPMRCSQGFIGCVCELKEAAKRQPVLVYVRC